MSVRIDRVAMIAEMARKNINCKRLVELSEVSRVTVADVRNGKAGIFFNWFPANLRYAIYKPNLRCMSR